METATKIAQENTLATGTNQGLNIAKIRQDFPMLQSVKNGKPLIFLDSAATSQKPTAMTDRLLEYYTQQYGKIQESHTLSEISTQAYEDVRAKTADLIGAKEPKEIVFTQGATEGINIVAAGFARAFLKEDDEVLITMLEHHANIVPWQMACEQTGAKLKVAPINKSGELDLQQFEEMISKHTKIISVVHSSQVLGTILPIRQIADLAHTRGIPVMVDGAQMAPHSPINMQELDCDFYAFSAHKMGGPSGVGVLYGKGTWLDKLPPHNGGSEMAKEVTFDKATYKDYPHKFEAGTPAFAEVIAFGSVIDYVQNLPFQAAADYEQELLQYATKKLSRLDQVKIYGEAPEKEPVLSFEVKNMDVKALEKYLNDNLNIAVRAGELSSQPLMKFLGVSGLLRVSFCYYNTREEIDTLVSGVEAFIRENE